MGIIKKHGSSGQWSVLRFICKLVPALFGVTLVIAIVLVPFVCTSNGVMETKTIRPAYLAKDINIDGVHYDNYFLEKPIMQAHGEIYIPASRQMLSVLGIRYANVYSESEEFPCLNPWKTPIWKSVSNWLRKSHSESADNIDILEFRLDKASPVDIGNALVTNLKAYTTLTTSPYEFWIARVSAFGNADIRNGWDRVMQILSENPGVGLRDYGTEFFRTSEEFELLSQDGSELFYDEQGMMYFSTAFLEMLGLDCEYDDLTGLYISTVAGVSASSFYDEELANRINILSDYMLSCNKKLDKETAIEYEYIFRHEATVHELDELIVMAVARTESNFRAEAKGSGTIGMMQPMAKYAVNYGYDYEMLLTPHYNVELCSMYLMDRYHMFGSDELMLVAYNKGPAAVRAGRISSDYSDKVLGIRDTLLELLNVQS